MFNISLLHLDPSGAIYCVRYGLFPPYVVVTSYCHVWFWYCHFVKICHVVQSLCCFFWVGERGEGGWFCGTNLLIYILKCLQFYDLLNIFELNGLPSDENPYLFNGDFVDRGSFSLEIILTLFAFKCMSPAGKLYLSLIYFCTSGVVILLT